MLTPEQLQQYQDNGYIAIENFLSEDEIIELKTECKRLIDEIPEEELTRATFNAEDETKAAQVNDDYFLDSGDKIRYFCEDDAVEDGKLKVDKHQSLNKIGHALHWLNPVFKRITFSQKVKNVIRDLGMIDPVVVQSMYIFKNPSVGGGVSMHQDGTYLNGEPLKLVGLWIPLEDATIENGCLFFKPGSNQEPLHRLSTVSEENGYRKLKYLTPAKEHDLSAFVPCPAKKGTCVVIHGKVVHMSARNLSEKPRPAYTFHIFDNHEATYSKDNWLQPTAQLPFPSLNLVKTSQAE